MRLPAVLALACAGLTGAQTAPRVAFERIFGGSNGDLVRGVGTDAAGNIYVIGTTSSFDFPTVNAMQPVNTGTSLAVSSDGGVSWTSLPSPTRYPIALVPTDAGLFLADSAGLYRSTNGGQSWQGLAAQPLQTLAGGPSGKILYAASPQAVLRSTDQGATWKIVKTTAAYEYIALSADPFHPETAFATMNSRLFRTADAGDTWTEIPADQQVNRAPVFDPATSGLVYVAAGTLVLRSTDSGRTWTDTRAPFTSYVTALAAGPSVVYAHSGGALFSFGGERWSRVNDGVFGSFLTADPFHPRRLAFDGSMSVDSGLTWAPPAIPRSVTGIAFDARTPDVVYARTAIATDLFITKFDPAGERMLYSTYLGGSGSEMALAAAVDGAGNVYIVGSSNSPDFPSASPEPPNWHSFVLSINPDGTALRYSKGVGRNASTASIAVWPSGEVAVAFGADSAGLLLKLNATGTDFLFVTRIPASVSSITALPSGGALITGESTSLTFPSGFQPKGSYAFVARIDAAGEIEAGTYLSGSLHDSANVAAIDASGRVWVAGSAQSMDFPLTAGTYSHARGTGCTIAFACFNPVPLGTSCSYRDDSIFVSRFNASFSELEASTLVGTSCYQSASALTIDTTGNVWVAGQTNSLTYPMRYPTNGRRSGGFDAVVSSLDPDLKNLRFSTYLAGDAPPYISADPVDNVVLAARDQAGSLAVATRYTPAEAPAFSLDSAANVFDPARRGAIAPGELLELRLTGFTPAEPIDLGLQGTPAATLGGVRVLFDGAPVPLIAVTPERIVCIAPKSLAPGATTTVQALQGAARSNEVRFPIARYDLAILSADGTGMGMAAAWDENGVPNRADHPATEGSVVAVLLNGGPVVSCFQQSELVDVGQAPGWVDGIYLAHVRVKYVSFDNRSAIQCNADRQAPSMSQVLSIYSTAP